jgi:O-antigen/teichoic acid export membrane protein
MKAMITHQVGDVFVNSTDSIMISSFIGLQTMGLYSNYLLISTTVHGILVQVLNAVTASVGNLTATESPEKRYLVFKRIFLVNAWMFGFSAVCLWILLDPFISIWVGDGFHLPSLVVSLVCANFLFTGMRKTAIIFRNTHGLFWNDRFIPIAEAVVNLVASVVLVQYIGLPGILLGKLISTVTTCMWVEPYVLYKNAFRMPLIRYFGQYAFYMATIASAAGATYFLGNLLLLDGWMELLYKFALCMIVPNAVFLLAWGRSESFRHMKVIAIRKLLRHG